MRSTGTEGSGTVASLSIAAALLLVACGGDGADDSGNVGGAGSAGSGGRGDVTLPDSCSKPSDCPTGYDCVPKGNVQTMTVTDMDCLNNCNQACELAGPIKDMCLMTCKDSCKEEVPVAGAKVDGTCMHSQYSGNEGGAGAAVGGKGGSGGADQSNTASLMWSGAWTADVAHTSKCKFSSATQMGQQSYTVTINATGANTAPKATINGGFALEGTGGNDHINLTGDFPFRSWKGEVATTNSLNSPNNATIKITSVQSPNKATGSIEGSWDASGGWTCTTESGTITLTR